MRRISTILLLFFTVIITSKAQEIVKRCALDDIIQHELLNDPQLTAAYINQLSGVGFRPTVYDSSLAATDSVYTVQVVIHIVYLNNNKYENIPDNIIQSQIDQLNTAYNSLNADTINLRSFFIPFRGNARIKFELAKFKPNGSPTTGIERVQGKLGTVGSFNPIFDNMKRPDDIFSGAFGSGAPSWSVGKYLNIWVCDLNYASRKCHSCLTLCDTCGALGGYAYPPSSAINWGGLALDHGANDGVVIDFRFFGQNNWYALDSTSDRFRSFYAMGKSTVHEVGHYLGLQHSWGNVVNIPPLPYTDGCTVDDFIDDTPEEEKQFSANLPHGFTNPCDTSINTCTKDYLGRDWPDMFEDYMDYSTDACYNLFTKQQVNLMRYNLLTRRSGLIIKRELAPTIPTYVRNTGFKNTGISFYPNPSRGIMNIHFDKLMSKDIVVDIMDLTGKVVASQLIKKNETDHALNVQSLSNGIYTVKFHNDDFSAADKFVKD